MYFVLEVWGTSTSPIILGSGRVSNGECTFTCRVGLVGGARDIAVDTLCT